MNIAQLQSENGPVHSPDQEQLQKLRGSIDELVGMTFFDTILKISRDSAMQGAYGHGGRGEEVFRQQLDNLLAGRVAQSAHFPLAGRLYEQMSRIYRLNPGNPNSGADA